MKRLKCVLLVDDNIHDNYFHTLKIKEADAAEQIKTAEDGAEALEYLEKAMENSNQHPLPDVIFLDINMPKVNGFEFLETAGKKNYLADRKPVVIMLTGSFNPNDEKTAREKFSKQVSEYIKKPLTAEMLKQIIEKYF